MITFQVERFGDVIDEALPLLNSHWAEIAEDRDCIPLSPNYRQYAELDAKNKLLICTGRRAGKLIGYACFIVDFGLHYSTVLVAKSDVIWMSPDERRLGAKAALGLVDLFERELLGRGVCTVRIGSKLKHPALARLLAYKGYVAVETISKKMLQRPE